ncbi:ATP-dependent DNA helicase pif1 [Eumeta japonica]|uniref:ATP-dependent DNA helicase n=2 Tax=Eumeta variegata TaxID=151549 RepID=A0A4C1XSC3_EUMVA|nr:ATP-dependent DNA helicase pif1 [Eumeta japonica]
MINNPKQNQLALCAHCAGRRGGREAVLAGKPGGVQLYEIPCRGSPRAVGSLLNVKFSFSTFFLHHYNAEKRTQLSRQTATAKRLRVLRSNETEDENMHRLATQRAITEQNRARESSVERSQRLASQNSELWRTGNGNRVLIVLNVSSQNARTLANRDRESSAERSQRLASQNSRTLANRDRESSAERSQRLTQQNARSTRNRTRRQHNLLNAAFAYDCTVDYSELNDIDIGRMDKICNLCQAKKWAAETPGLCCSGGKVNIPIIPEPTSVLKELISGSHPSSKHFLNHSRQYNTLFQMTSFGAKEIREGNFMPTFKVQGQVYHLIGDLLPAVGAQPEFLQIYFVSHADQVSLRSNLNPSLQIDLIDVLQTYLHDHNTYIQSFKYNLENRPPNDLKLIIHADVKPPNEHRGRYNAPVVDEVAVLMIDEDKGPRDIVLTARDGRLQRVSEIHRSYDPLQYPLLFPFGNDGYCINIPQQNTTATSKTVSLPEHFISETQTGDDGYPTYRRRSPDNGGFTAIIRVKGTEMSVDNRWVVPYNPLLSRIFNAHINVEFCQSVKAIKYISGGRTAHSTFKLPLTVSLEKDSVCSIRKNGPLGKVLQDVSLIIWDECTMIHRAHVEALDRTLRDIRNCDKIMGGITVMFAGDFRQTLPVIVRGTRADIVKACLKSSPLWKFVNILKLSTNMRAHLGGGSITFPSKLLSVGDGKIPHSNNKIEIDCDLGVKVGNIEELITKVYPDISQIENKDHQWMCQRAILAARNSNVDEINDIILSKLPGDIVTYTSIDTVMDQEDVVNYPQEFLNSLNPSGLPPHSLNLKIGAPIILLRNLKPPNLCNGTRLQVKFLRNNVIVAIVLTGPAVGQTVLIPASQ